MLRAKINAALQEWHSSIGMKLKRNSLFIIWSLTSVKYCISEESTAYRSSISFKTINLYLLEWWICTNFLNWRHGNINFEVHPQKAFNRRRQKVFYITVFSALNDRSSFEKHLILKKGCSMILTLSTFLKNCSTTQCTNRYNISIFATVM